MILVNMRTSCNCFTFSFILVAVLLFTDTASGMNGGNDPPGHKQPMSQQNTVEHTSPGILNLFDAELLQRVANEEQGNFVISPASIKTLLGLIVEGAEGNTLQELQDLLRLPTNMTQAHQLLGSLQAVLKKMQNSSVIVYSKTNAFISNDLNFNTTYVKSISELYDAEQTKVDFTLPKDAAQKINSWVLTQTQGKIPTLISEDKIDPLTMSILVNTVYFDGKWKYEFQPKRVNEECFYSEPLKCSVVEMMDKEEVVKYSYRKDLNSHVVKLPYKDEKFSMILVVPEDISGISQLTQNLNKLTLPGLLDYTVPVKVHLKLPKFTVEYQAKLKHTLIQMGLNSVFSEEAKLPYMINNTQGQVTDVVHKAKIEVSEKGTKGAAASGVSFTKLTSHYEPDPVVVTADHPFYYFIYEMESKSVLFSGRISSLEGVRGNGGKA